ncbi:MAG: hypothetical protein WCG76_05490 [Verrucomicrobiota bacterium]
MKPSIILFLLSTVAAFGGDSWDAYVRLETLNALQKIERNQRDALLDAQLQAIWSRSKCNDWNRSPYLKDPLLSPCLQPRQNPFYFWK